MVEIAEEISKLQAEIAKHEAKMKIAVEIYKKNCLYLRFCKDKLNKLNLNE